MVGPRKRVEVRGKGEGEGWAACCWAAAGRREKGWAAQGFVWAGHWVWVPFSFTTSISSEVLIALSSFMIFAARSY